MVTMKAAKKPKDRKAKKKRTTKGALIKGMSKQLPSDILESPIFKQRLKELMKGYAGIYVLYRKKKLYYVGLTTNLQHRIKHHMKDRHAGRWDSFVIFRIKRVTFLKDIETLVMRLVDPPGNKVRGKVPKDADINRVLKDILREHEKEIRVIKKALKRK